MALSVSSADGTPGFIHAPGGKRYRDKRAPGQAVPRWLEDPFQKSTRAKNSKWRGLISRDLLVFKAKAQRGKGGVYEAVDLSVLPVRRVIIKEGRRHGETNWDGRDGYALVKHEARVLRKLRKAGLPVPEIFREFTKMEIAISFSNKSRTALCCPQNECNHQEPPGVEQRGFWSFWDQCSTGCTPPAGSGAIASHRTFLFIEEHCGSSISKAHAASIKPNYLHGVHQTISRHRIAKNSHDGQGHWRMITRSA